MRPTASTSAASAQPTGAARLLGRAADDARAAWVVAALIFVAGIPYYLAADINHDSAWFLDATARWLDGARLYVDLLETNPPLAFYLTAPVVWLARATGLFAPHVFVGTVFVLIALSLLASCRVLAGAPRMPAVLARWLPAAAAVVLVAGPLRDFGQREHLATILALPYFLLLATRVEGGGCTRRMAIAVGLAAALGLALKPYFLLAPVGAELYLLARTRAPGRLVRPETLALACAVLLYAASIPLLAPEYLSHVLPMGAAVFQAGYGAPLAATLFAARTFLVALVLALGLRAVFRPAAPYAAVADVFLVYALAFAAAYLLQMKGWSYHLYPVLAGTALAGSAMLIAALGLSAHARRKSVALWAALATALPVVGAAADHLRYGDFARAATPVVRARAAGGSVYVFGTNVSAAYPVILYAGVRNASRFQTLWPLPGLVRRRAAGDADPRLADIERFLRDAVAEDFARDPPALVIVDDRPRKSYFGGLAFDYLAWFGRDPRFAAIWTNYRETERIGDFRTFVRR